MLSSAELFRIDPEMHMVEKTLAIAGPVIENSSVLGSAEQVPPHCVHLETGMSSFQNAVCNF
jgi:hypothetical protein